MSGVKRDCRHLRGRTLASKPRRLSGRRDPRVRPTWMAECWSVTGRRRSFRS